MMRVSLILALLAINSSFQVSGYKRISADFTIKETLKDAKKGLQLGKVYYDINSQKLLYDLNFPETQKLVVTDSCTYKIVADTLQAKSMIPGFIEQSIFHLVLSGGLKDFGLSESALEIDKVERNNDMVITTWIPAKKNKLFKGKILVSIKDKNLMGVVYLDDKGKVISKQFYEDYATISGLTFPRKIIYIVFGNKGEKLYKVLTFRNIKLNESRNETLYNYPIPG